MFVNVIEEINRFRKKINRLLIEGMSNIYLKVTIEKKLTFSSLLNGVPNVPTCPTCSTCPMCPRAKVYFTDRKIKK